MSTFTGPLKRTGLESVDCVSWSPPCHKHADRFRQSRTTSETGTLGANEVGHDRRHRAVETDDIERARVVWIGNREAVGGHADHNQLGVDAHLLPILRERLHRVNLTEPRLAI